MLFIMEEIGRNQIKIKATRKEIMQIKNQICLQAKYFEATGSSTWAEFSLFKMFQTSYKR